MTQHLHYGPRHCPGRRYSRLAWQVTLVTHRPAWQRVALKIASPFLTLAFLGLASGTVTAGIAVLLQVN